MVTGSSMDITDFPRFSLRKVSKDMHASFTGSSPSQVSSGGIC